ncbi:hypothetical protein COLO4_18053 [Corchorus olitorius]|uniref:Uncharacterized protein n=1 Tax=Corchorus olitorius TaxID=93759 RepID=A0A1R3JAP8_9ROSI|nr:hypothetical protein COLO4_18053 [Corchorus olitorius]
MADQQSRYVKLTKDQALVEDITPGEPNQPIDVPQICAIKKKASPLLIGEALYEVTGFNIGAPTINNTTAASSYVRDLLLI